MLGNEIRAAALLALGDYRTRRGSDALPISFSFYDDGCSADTAASIAKQIVAARPIAVVGHACPSAAQAAAPIYGTAGILFISAGALPARPFPTRRSGPHHFRFPAGRAQGTAIATQILAGNSARIAVIRDRTQYAIEATLSIAESLGTNARNIIIQEQFAGGEKDFTGLAQRIKSARISHILMSAFPNEAALLITEIRKASPDIVIAATDQLADPEFARSAPEAANGIVVSLPADYDRLPSAMNVMRRLGSMHSPFLRPALETYAAFECLVSALELQWPATEQSIAKALMTGQFDTILGPVHFDSEGSASLSKFALYTWDRGNLVPIRKVGATDHGVASSTTLP